MDVRWDDKLLTGDQEIDHHHQIFFSRARAIVVACSEGRGGEVVDETIRFLVEYAKFHFAAEEQRMQRSAYPYANTHEAQHQSFLSRLEMLQQAYRQSSDKDAVAREVARFAVDWFIHHIQNSDQPLARYLSPTE